MRRIILHSLASLIGAALGSSFLPFLWLRLNQPFLANNNLLDSFIGALIFLGISFIFIKPLLVVVEKIDQLVASLDLKNLLSGFVGVLGGLFVGTLVSIPLWILNIPLLSSVGSSVIMILLAYSGYLIITRRGQELLKSFRQEKKMLDTGVAAPQSHRGMAKYLDTSVIIDGRIVDVLQTGFIDGVIVIPEFVVYELQLLADATDSLKRQKGRRGLDFVKAIQAMRHVEVEMLTHDYPDIREVDTKLLHLVHDFGGKLVTNDFNLNKVAQIQDITVLNINDLANAVKTQAASGEVIEVTILKKGEQRQQGVGYMADGTMVVVENAAHSLNQKLQAEVLNTVQTSAGRMIFAEAMP